MHSRTRPFRLLGLMGVLGALLLTAGAPGAAAKPPPRPAAGPGTNHATDDPFTSSRTSWWRQDRFGMFIHFGAYSNLEGEYTRPDGTVCRNAEWIKRECRIPDEEYEKQAATFNPSAFDAKAIVRAAKDAGQRYIVITSKHHDGYAMWPTKQNTWNLRDHSSFDPHRDILAELKQAADAAGIKLGFYYSIWDWHDPDFAGPATFPRYKKRMYAQLKELVDHYDPALLVVRRRVGRGQPHQPLVTPGRRRPPGVPARPEPRPDRQQPGRQARGGRRRLRHAGAGDPHGAGRRAAVGELYDAQRPLGLRQVRHQLEVGGDRGAQSAGCGEPRRQLSAQRRPRQARAHPAAVRRPAARDRPVAGRARSGRRGLRGRAHRAGGGPVLGRGLPPGQRAVRLRHRLAGRRSIPAPHRQGAVRDHRGPGARQFPAGEGHSGR